jgi:hypothetical protein
MSAHAIEDGWIAGKLLGPSGDVPVRRQEKPPYVRLATATPNLVLHTTETDRLVPLQYPSQFQVGEGVIVQHRPLWAKGEALRGDTTNDPYAMQIEIVGRSRLDVWLPGKSSLEPLVALVAFLHQENLIRTGLARPTDWPTRLDRGPQAVEGYYRRHAGLWHQTAGVYGHVEIPINTHWDPGSFDYPRFFGMVRDVLNADGGEDDMRFEDYLRGFDKYVAARKALDGADPGQPPDTMDNADARKGWSHARFAANNPKVPKSEREGSGE